MQEKEKVRQGRLLAELRSDDHRAAFAEAKARVVEADAVVGRRLEPQDPGKPEDTRLLLVKVALLEPTPLRLGQRVEIGID